MYYCNLRMGQGTDEITYADSIGTHPSFTTLLVSSDRLATPYSTGRIARYITRTATARPGLILMDQSARREVRARRARVTRSPRLAAIGVATLSGFTPYLADTGGKNSFMLCSAKLSL